MTGENVPSPRMNAELLLMFTLSCDRAYLYAHPERELSLDEDARANAARHQLEQRIHFHRVNLLEGLAFGFDIVVSNPPYVGESEADQVQLEVKKFEPRNAVFAGPTGVEVIQRLIPQAHSRLRPGGWVVLEISGTIAFETKQLLHDWTDVAILPDLQSLPRTVMARKAEL